MRYRILIFIFAILICQKTTWAEESTGKEPHNEDHHDHKDEKHDDEGQADHEGEHKDEHEGEHGEADEHGTHEEEAPSNVGPQKGILEANASKGIKLSPEALKNFEIRTLKLIVPGPWTLPSSAKLSAGEEVNIYRVRENYFKRIDFKLLKKTHEQMSIASDELKVGDEIVINGVGFLRIAEIAAFGGAPSGHSH